jgi:hypothetical protein
MRLSFRERAFAFVHALVLGPRRSTTARVAVDRRRRRIAICGSRFRRGGDAPGVDVEVVERARRRRRGGEESAGVVSEELVQARQHRRRGGVRGRS